LNLRPTDYESVALPLSYTGNAGKLAFNPGRPAPLPQYGSMAEAAADGIQLRPSHLPGP
jgi:hypothetical protein